MRVVLNDIAFEYSLYERDKAIRAVHDFISLCGFLESERCHNVNRIIMTTIDSSKALYLGGSLYKIVQEIKDKDKRSYLLSLLTNRESSDISSGTPFIFDGHLSHLCATAIGGCIVSILTNSVFDEPTICGEINNRKVKLNNLATQDHVIHHGALLGLRIYEANSEKHKKDHDNPYGKGKVGSPMDLDDMEAQMLLDKAIVVNSRLYARKGNNYYAFQNTHNFTYHGYIDSTLNQNIISAINRSNANWD